MSKVLYVATTAKTHINLFHLPYIKWLKEQGCVVDVSTNGDDNVPFVDNEFTISIERSPYNVKNIVAIFQLAKIMKRGKYDLVSCHTPMGGIVARIAALFAKPKLVLYMAHGFHFYHNAPLINNIVYRVVEGLLARYTDILITINDEDYKAACQFKLRKSGKVYKMNGIGLSVDKFSSSINATLNRSELQVKSNEIIFVNIAEMIKRKNQEMIIRAFANAGIDNARLIICGDGVLRNRLENIVRSLGMQNKILLLGFRNDIHEILSISDVFVFFSFQEGLPIAILEAMATPLPVICSNVRGCCDLIDNNGGIILNPTDIQGFTDAMISLSESLNMRECFAQNNRKAVVNYDLRVTLGQMCKILSEFNLL